MRRYWTTLLLFLSVLVSSRAQDTITVHGGDLKAVLSAEAAAGRDLVVLIEPGVYWLDDPDDPAIRRNEGNSEGTPYALRLKCNSLQLIGQGQRPDDVVLAVNRGQTQGAMGNYTMLWLDLQRFNAERITFGNYCNVDLEYRRDPSQNRQRRASAIVQAQLIHTNADTATLQDCRFISRLNLCPCNGAKQVFFTGCHFECTDDALPGNGHFTRCDFDFYGDKPFYNTIKEGARMTDCEIRTHLGGQELRFVKDGGMVILRNTSIDGQSIALDTLPKGLARLPKQRGHAVPQNFGDDKPTENRAMRMVNAAIETHLITDFHNIHIDPQPQVGQGLWTFDAYKPADTGQWNWTAKAEGAWYYGTGEDGCNGVGLVHAARGARFFYTPRRSKVLYSRLLLKVDPAKQAGQGFGSATGQYMDCYINFDPKTLTGYALRIERSPLYGKAVLMTLVQYRNGVVKAISESVATACFRSTCPIELKVRNGKFTATAMTSAPLTRQMLETPASQGEQLLPIQSEVYLEATVGKLPECTSVGVLHTGTAGSGAAMIHLLEADWK